MKILYLAHRIPYPPDKGDKMRAYRHLAHLASTYDVWCACFVDTPEDRRHADTLNQICRGVTAVPLNPRKALLRGAARMMRGGTLTEGYYDHPDMHRAIDELCEHNRFDVVVAFSSSMAPYALRVPAHRHVLDMCDLDSAKWTDYARHTGGPMGLMYQLEGKRLSARERVWARAFDATTLISPAEAADLRALAPEALVFVVTNGVDVPDVSTATGGLSVRDAGEGDRHPTIGFVGVMDYRPNVDGVVSFVNDCWSEIRSQRPTVEFRIVGRRPTRAVKRLARVPGVTVVGEVPAVATELRSIDVSIAPLNIARGLQNKILEAMACGVPVVASEAAARGIDHCDGDAMLVANGPDCMIRHITRLLGDPDERRRVGRAGRDFVLGHHRWSDAMERLELIATGIIRPAQSSAAIPRSAAARSVAFSRSRASLTNLYEGVGAAPAAHRV